MSQTDDDDAIRQMREEAARQQQLPEPETVTMPSDPSLGADALFLRTYGRPAALFLKDVQEGRIDATPEQIMAAKTLLPYETKAQASKVETTVTADEGTRLLINALRDVPLEHAEAAREALLAHAEAQAKRLRLVSTRH